MTPLRFKVRSPDGKLVASCMDRDDAIAICRRHGIGSKIQHMEYGQLWTEPLLERVDFHRTGELIQAVINRKREAQRQHYERTYGVKL